MPREKTYRCSEQERAAARAYYAKNRERLRERQSEYNRANRGEIQRKQRLYNFRKYGVTPEWAAAQLEAQGGLCAICKTDSPGGRGRWHVDHDHETGAVRGLLCCACNLGIGHLKDSTDVLRAALAYLENPPATPSHISEP